VFFTTLGFACIEPYFFIGYLISMALFGLYQAIFMANAGGAWDNAKKIVETELRAKGTDLHAATVVGDTVGDPFKDTSSVALNPVIKFTTLFGVLAVGLAIELENNGYTQIKYAVAGISLMISFFFAWRSFYGMRITSAAATPMAAKPTVAKVEPKIEKVAAAKEESPTAKEINAEAKAEERASEKESVSAAKEPDKAKDEDKSKDDSAPA